MQLGSEGAKIPLPAAGPGQSHAGRPGKFDFYCSKRHRLAYYLFIFYIKFSVAWGIFVYIWAREMIMICDFLVSWKILIHETLNLTRESWSMSR